ncbi:MAG TPA: DUF4956 domain-containing protein [Ignavibacteriaceae bacterium]|nr:DUF4956 domain-containing protein [Ignavibacteriaceae bacterium]
MDQHLQNLFQFTISAGQVFESLIVSFLCGLIIVFFYKMSYKGPGFTTSFLSSLVILTMITALVIMVIGNNLARAFGLVGAMSIIRFRTAVKETMDIIFIFFALAIGLTAGVGFYKAAFAAAILIGCITLLLSRAKILTSYKKHYLLQFITSESEANGYSDILKKYCSSYKLVNVKNFGSTDSLELAYYINLKDQNNSNIFVGELKKIHGISNINVFYEEDNF